MFTDLPKAYTKEPEKSLAAQGWDVQWFNDSLGYRNQRNLYPPPVSIIWASAGSFSGSVSYIAYWDVIISQACDWLFENFAMIGLG